MIAPGLAATAVKVSVDGQPLGLRVLGVRIAARCGAPTQCEVAVHDPAGLPRWPAPGALNARLAVGVVGDDAPLFEGELTCVELHRAADGTTTAHLRGYDLVHRLRGRQTLRVLTGVDAASVARTLTSDLGLSVVGGDGPAMARVVQHRQSDFELLVEVAARSGHLVVTDGPTLRLVTLDGYGEPVPLHYGDTLYEVSVEANTHRVAASVAAIGWDTETAAPFRAVASAPRSGRRIALDVPAGRDLALVEQRGASADDVSAAAQFALDLRTASAVVVRGVAAGDGRLRPGVRIALHGVGPQVDGRHVLTEVTHTIGGDGYQTRFATEPPAPPRADDGASAITLGLVTDADDPDGRGRVRVTLPSYGDIDAGWLGVACPGAGAGKGIVALPDAGDTVVVALPHADPAGGIVLGSLYGARKPPDDGVDGGSVARFTLRTRDGQTVVLDDGGHRIRLENHDGSHVTLGPDKVEIVAKTDLVLDAAGHGITIRASSVDFEHAVI